MKNTYVHSAKVSNNCHKIDQILGPTMIMDSIKDHLIPHIYDKNMMKEMFDNPVGLYHRKNINMKMILHNKLRYIEMTISDTITSYLMKVT
jgi:hypothetical protein